MIEDIKGDSSGANIAHDMVVRAGINDSGLIKFLSLVLVHPFFGNNEPDKLWMYLCPDSTGANDPRLNPAADPTCLARLGCKKVLICLVEKDHLRDRGLKYLDTLKKSGWNGEAEILETEGEGHVFHLFKQDTERSAEFLKQVAVYIKFTHA